jgi:hypothetical protein
VKKRLLTPAEKVARRAVFQAEHFVKVSKEIGGYSRDALRTFRKELADARAELARVTVAEAGTDLRADRLRVEVKDWEGQNTISDYDPPVSWVGL